MSAPGIGRLSEASTKEDLRDSEIALDRAIDSLRGIAEAGRMAETIDGNSSTNVSGSAIMSIPVEVHAVFGAAKMSMAELSALGPGATIVLDRKAGDPVDIVANGVRIATGEMVLLDEEEGRFGFRLVDILK